MKTFNHLYIIIFLFVIAFTANAQKAALKVGTNPTTIDPSAVLELESTTKGFLPPRINLTGTLDVSTIASPATGLTVYNKTAAGTAPNNVLPGFYYWNGTKWMATSGDGSNNWSLTGNAGTTPATNFIGTTDAQDLVLKTNNIEKMRVTSDGNVGIGTAIPVARLDLQSVQTNGDLRGAFFTNYGVNHPFLLLRSAGGIPGYGAIASKFNDILGSFSFTGYNGSSFGTAIYNTSIKSFATEDWGSTNNGANLVFSTTPIGAVNALQRMTITDAGFVGIGTTNPQAILETVGEEGNNRRIMVTNYSNFSNTPSSLLLRKSRGTEASPLGLIAGDLIGDFSFKGHNGSAFDDVKFPPGMWCRASQNWTTGAYGSIVSFMTVPDNSNISQERMTILQNGKVGIGNATPVYTLDVIGSIGASAGMASTSYGSYSDIRLKRNIKNIDNALQTVAALRPVSYEKKQSIDVTEYKFKENGFIAQEVRKVLPDAVFEGEDKDKTLGIYYMSIIPVLTKAIQEQQAQIEKQQAQIEELKALIKAKK